MYSSIKRKLSKCVDCPEGADEKYVTAGRCGYHYVIHRNKVAQARKKEQAKVRGLVQVKGESDLVKWYKEKMEKSVAICENCKKISLSLKANKKLWHSAQAHILPKSLFPSAATHPFNHMVLFSGLSSECNCHSTYDSSWDKAANMPVFEIAKERFKLFEKDIAPEERRRIPEIFYQ